MDKSNRKYNVARNLRTKDLLGEIKKDAKKDLAWVPIGYISRKDAQRKPFFLNETDLMKMNHLAYHGGKKGQSGIFYPLEEISVLAEEKTDINPITQDMLSEATLVQQLPKDYIDFENIRPLGFYGTRLGHHGRATYFYTVGTIEEELGVQVLKEGTLEGVDFVKEKNVALNVKTNIAAPTLCIWTVASGRAEFCYLKPQVVADILSRGGWVQPCARRSARVFKEPQADRGGDDLTPSDHPGPGQGVHSDAMVDQGPLGGVEPDQDQEDARSDNIWDLYD